MPDPTAPRPDVPDELRERLLAADLTSHVVIASDGYASVVTHTNEEAADRALTVFAEWLPARDREIERQVRERVAADIDAERAGGTEHWDIAMDHAARIARGES